MKLSGRRALVTGGSSGIGRAIGQKFQGEGARVMFVGRREGRLREAGRDWLTADLTRSAECERAVAATVERFGGLALLVNAAGVIGNGGILDGKPEEWSR